MVTPRKKAQFSARSKKRPTTRGVSNRQRQSRQAKYQKEKLNHVRVAKHRENCRQNAAIKRDRANIAAETMATQAREIERLKAIIAILEQQDLPGDDNDEVLDEMDEASEEIERHVKANPKWWEPVEARGCESMKQCIEWHKVIGIEKAVFEKLAKDYSMAYKNTTWHGTKRDGCADCNNTKRSLSAVCLPAFLSSILGWCKYGIDLWLPSTDTRSNLPSCADRIVRQIQRGFVDAKEGRARKIEELEVRWHTAGRCHLLR